MARSRIATGANGQNGGYRNHPFPTQLPRNAGTVKVSAPAPPFPLLPPVQKIQSFIVPAPRPLAAFAPWRFKFLPKGIDAHRATLQAIQNPKSNIQNPSSSASLGGLRALAVQISSQRHRRSQSDATSQSKSNIQHSKSLFFRVPWRPPRLGGSNLFPSTSMLTARRDKTSALRARRVRSCPNCLQCFSSLGPGAPRFHFLPFEEFPLSCCHVVDS